jgi:class 3 adenylate cyclase
MEGPATEPEHPPREAWTDVVNDRLGGDLGPALQFTRVRRRRMVGALSTLSGRSRDATVELDPEIVSLLALIGLEAGKRESWMREFAATLDEGEAAGIDRGALPHVLQAYVRAVSRIVAVEASVALGVLRSVEADRRAEVIGQLVDQLLPTSLRGFDLLHRTMLHDALLEAPHGLDADESESEAMAVAMVDLVRSTDYFLEASAAELEELVDAMFAAGQAATSERAAHILKYVGDGVFIAANDVGSVADVALDLIARLERDLPLRARGGISYGSVLQRAGDMFGMPVNLAQALTKAARPGTVLLSADAAALLPRARRGRLRSRRLPHPALAEQQVATLQAPARG